MMNALRSILFNLSFYVFTTLYCLIWMMPLVLFGSKQQVRAWITPYCRICLAFARFFVGIRYEYRGVENLPSEGGYILAAAHQSYADPLLFYLLRDDVTALAKKELFSTPLIGAILKKIDIIRIDRQSGRAHADMAGVSDEITEKQIPLLLYAQGTRTKPGEGRRLKPGAWHLAAGSDIPVVPVATSAGQFWSRGFWHRPGVMVFEIHPPFTARGETKDSFMKKLDTVITERSNTLLREGGFEGQFLPAPGRS